MTQRRQLTSSMEIILAKALAGVHTMTIARVTAVNKNTIDVQPVIPRIVNGQPIALPEFPEVLPLFLGGGDSSETWPIAVGDYALLFFAERCLDAWFVGRDGEAPPEKRMHDYSDAVALVGIKNLAGLLDIPAMINRVGDMLHEGNLQQTGDRTLTGNDTVDGDSTTTGNVEAATYSVSGEAGATGTFISQDGKTVTVAEGIITGIA